MKKTFLCLNLLLSLAILAKAQKTFTSSNLFLTQHSYPTGTSLIIPGAERINVYLPLIKGKKVGIFANQTSRVGATHLVDTLKRSGVDI